MFFKGVEGDFATQRDVSRRKRDIKTIVLKVRLDNPKGAYVPGMTAEVLVSPSNSRARTRRARRGETTMTADRIRRRKVGPCTAATNGELEKPVYDPTAPSAIQVDHIVKKYGEQLVVPVVLGVCFFFFFFFFF